MTDVYSKATNYAVTPCEQCRAMLLIRCVVCRAPVFALKCSGNVSHAAMKGSAPLSCLCPTT